MRIAVRLLVLTVCIAALPAYGQKCNVPSIFYVIRDEGGKPLNEVALKSVVERLPKTVGASDRTTNTAPATLGIVGWR